MVLFITTKSVLLCCGKSGQKKEGTDRGRETGGYSGPGVRGAHKDGRLAANVESEEF